MTMMIVLRGRALGKGKECLGKGTDDDEVPSEEVTLEFLAKISGNEKKWVPTANVEKRMQDALNDMMISQCSSSEEHEYHLDKIKRYMESQIVWESRPKDLTLHILEKPAPVYEGCKRDPNAPPRYLYNKDLFYLKNENSETRKYVLSWHKIHAFSFPKNNLEELNTRWVRKVIKRFNMHALYDVEHWKNLWARQSYIKGQLKKRAYPNKVYSDQRIVDVIKIQYDPGHEQEFMKEIVVKRADGEYSSFSELDYKYLHKNNIEDMYLMCLNVKIKYHETGILKSLNVLIRSSVIWERVHDYQLGVERYQLKVNLTASKLTFPGMEEKKPYTITSLPFVGLIYENNKKEKRIMGIIEISKLCDASLKRVLKEVKKINLDVKYGYCWITTKTNLKFDRETLDRELYRA
ncbi:hypothetical protein Tco_1576678 [Tanacetum coccineum]